MKCPKCGSEIEERKKFCSECGSKIHNSGNGNKTIKCPSCLTEKSVEDGIETITCSNCGSELIVAMLEVNQDESDETAVARELDRLGKQGSNFLADRNYVSALGISGKMLKIDPECVSAVVLKTISLLQLAKKDYHRIDEAIEAVHKCTEILKGTELESELAEDNSKDLHTIGCNIYGKLSEVIRGNYSDLTGAQIHNITRRALGAAYELNPDDLDIMKDYYTVLESGSDLKNKILNKIAEVDPAFANKHSRENIFGGNGPCFIATAVYGSYYCSEVVVLRKWRDGYLSKSFIGRSFIRFYYFIGPILAKQVIKSKFVANGVKNGLDWFVSYLKDK